MIHRFLQIVMYGALLTAQAGAQSGTCSKPEEQATAAMRGRALHDMQMKSYRAVEEELRQYVAEHPEQCDLSLLLGKAYVLRKKDRVAEKLFRDVLKRDGA